MQPFNRAPFGSDLNCWRGAAPVVQNADQLFRGGATAAAEAVMFAMNAGSCLHESRCLVLMSAMLRKMSALIFPLLHKTVQQNAQTMFYLAIKTAGDV